MLKRPAQGGFSLIELATAITILAILMMLSMPSISEYLQNARLGAAAQSFYSGLNLARSEAIRRNGPVEFAMTSTPIAAGVENTLTPDTSGKNWVVRRRPSASDPYDSPPIDSKTALEGGGSTPNVTVTATEAIVTFDSLGNAVTGIGTIALKNPAAGLCVPAGPVRCWDVRVAPGGQVHLCDPAASLGDSRAC
ncbi:MAG: GspH/FimT family pseudopilin [Caldimonas sp.]